VRRRLNLKIAFLQAGLSQREVAAETHVPENRLSEIVCGWIRPRDEEMTALSRVLKQPVAVLFGDDARSAD
jgi:hypothetical protein